MNDLALVVGRNLTRRDAADRQQPRNLRVGSTETRADGGSLYEIAHLQFFQGDLIRGYNDGDGPERGRRVLPQAMHSVGANPVTGGPPGSVVIGADGSVAAFVPAGRALSWQTTDRLGDPVVRERYWLTFQRGEIRVCGSCHGVNRIDQAGNPEPTNPPQALVQLLQHWKGIDHTAPLPTPVPVTSPRGYGIAVRTLGGEKIRSILPGRPFAVHLRGPVAGERLDIELQREDGSCRGVVGVAAVGASGAARVRLRLSRASGGVRMKFIASVAGREVARTSPIGIVGRPGKTRSDRCPMPRVLGGGV